MAVRNFNNTTTVGSLTAPIAPSDTSATVTDFSNYPTPPFTATIDRNTVSEEIVLVTAVNTGVLTITRGYNGTAATSHLAGGVVEHTAVALDFSEANAHTNATSNVHGTSGDLVGTEGSQTILDKTFISTLHEADTTLGDAVVAYVPEGAEVRNLFRGMDPDGDDVALIDSTGRFTGAVATAPEHLVRKEYVDAADVALDARLDPVEAVIATATSAATGSALVQRTSGGAADFTQVLLSAAPTVATHGATKSYVDGQVTSPVGGSRKLSAHWGSGTTFPTTNVLTGDTYEHTGLDCVMKKMRHGWRQIEPAEVANAAARTAISTSYSTVLHVGFQVYQEDIDFLYEWDGTGWRFVRFLGPGASAPRVRLAVTGMAAVANDDNANQIEFAVQEANANVATVSGSTITFQQRGLYSVWGHIFGDTGATERVFGSIWNTPAATPVLGGTSAKYVTAVSAYNLRVPFDWTGYSDAGWQASAVASTNYAHSVNAYLNISLIG